MRIGVISDIHGNLPALEAALGALNARGYDTLVALGDDVGYGPSPAECCALLDAAGALRIRGNHERRMHAYVQGLMPEADNTLQWATLRWTAQRAPASLYALPDTRVLPTDAGDILLIHYANDAQPHLSWDTRLVLSGHIHKPQRDDKRGVGYVSPGSVGFSQQGAPYTAECAIVTVTGRRSGGSAPGAQRGTMTVADAEAVIDVEFIAVQYDAARAIELFEDSGLMEASPEFSRIILESMRAGRDALGPFLRLCDALMRERGLCAPAYHDDVWREAARRIEGGLH